MMSRPKTTSDGIALVDAIAAAWPPHQWRDAHVVLAVSGGADSVAMLRAMLQLKERVGGSGQLHVAHLNHGLRPNGADSDAAWMATLCEQLQVPLEVGRADVAALAAERGDGLEAAAREARLAFLRDVAERLGARYVATAHTADDQTETVLQRILRGTGLRGLGGISLARPLSKSVTLVRPMLTVSREEVLLYLDAIGQDFRVDETNVNLDINRNWVRHELLPWLREQYSSEVDQALRRLAAQSRECHEVIEGLAVRLAENSVDVNATADLIRVRCQPLVGQAPYLVREVFRTAWQRANWPLQAMHFEEWQLLAGLAMEETFRVVNLPGNVRAERRDEEVVVKHLPVRPVLPGDDKPS